MPKPDGPHEPRLLDNDVYKDLIGVDGELSHFPEALQDALVEADDAPDGELQARRDVIAAHGDHPADIEVRGLPSAWSLAKLDEADWRHINSADSPFLALHSRVHVHELRAQADFAERAAPRKHRSHKDELEERARLASLPVIHQMTYEGLGKALETGRLISNRAVHERGHDASVSGNTHLADRQMGLDEYVFGDFGRPHYYRTHEQPEVTVVIKPEAMHQPGVVMTEQDHADCVGNPKRYADGLVLPGDFVEAAYQKIKASDSHHTYHEGQQEQHHALTVERFANGDDGVTDNLGQPLFSTWEVKMPEVSLDLVDTLIFRDADTLAAFQAAHGDTIPAILEPNLLAQNQGNKPAQVEREHYDLLRNPERFEQAYAELTAADYADRVQQLEAAGDTRRGFMILDFVRPDSDDARRLTTHADPKDFTNDFGPDIGSQLHIYADEAAVDASLFPAPGNYDLFDLAARKRADAERLLVAEVEYSPSTDVRVIRELTWHDRQQAA